MRFAVCEDDKNDLERMKQQLAEAMAQLEVEAEVDCFASAEALLQATDHTFYSAFFLDIFLPGTSGLDAAIKLRRVGNFSPVIFTTMTRDYLTQSYGVCATDYLVKPIAQKDVCRALERAMQLLNGEEKLLEITVARHTERLAYADIFYVEGNLRASIIHSRTGQYNPLILIRELYAALDDSRFFQCHRSYIINLDHVVAVQKDKVAMRNDVLLPIRRGATEQLRAAWRERCLAVLRGG